MDDTGAILRKAEENLKKGRAIATGIGIFVALHKPKKKILLRTRIEKGSDIYNKDLSGKLELPGGAVELNDFGESYRSAIVLTLKRELMEEAGLNLERLPKLIKMYPAWLRKDDKIDLAFVIPVPYDSDHIGETMRGFDLVGKNLVRFFSKEEVERIEITSPRMRFLINAAFKVI